MQSLVKVIGQLSSVLDINTEIKASTSILQASRRRSVVSKAQMLLLRALVPKRQLSNEGGADDDNFDDNLKEELGLDAKVCS